MTQESYVIGIDFGTDSVRSVIIGTAQGEEIASAVFYYPRWARGKFCDPSANQFRQHPLDYVESLEQSVKAALAQAPAEVAEKIKGIAVDTTGSTPVAVDKMGNPLALLPEFAENPNAMFILWKDHTAVKEAAEINQVARNWGGTDFTQYVGGIYSSEWFWAKLLHVLREDEDVRQAAYSWVEHCDWIPFLLTGGQDIHEMKRSRCAAGHKAMWHEKFEGLPSEDFLIQLDPMLAGLRDRLFRETYTSDTPAGNLSAEWAERLGLSTEVLVGVGAFDAHMGAVGGEIQPYYLSRVMGTSTCDILMVPTDELGDTLVKGICGQVDGSVVPGMMGLEAGQSAFGDVYAWFKQVISYPLELIDAIEWLDTPSKTRLKQEIGDQIIPALSEAAAQVDPQSSAVLALDWMNGRRTPDANQALKGAIFNLNLGSDAPRIFRALVEATCFGAKKIVDRFQEEGIPIKGIIGLGGVANKSPFVMQTLANVLNMPIQIVRSEQTCALGAAMFAATLAGIYPDVLEAQKNMGMGFEKTYQPEDALRTHYQNLYQAYSRYVDLVENEMMSQGDH
ncbi:MAG: ribulokinase [Microscillaceae bacterium]|nr:ribulokinase [Microscillaceae bacterium]